VSVGIATPDVTALGFISVEILREAGLWERVAPNVIVNAPTAHELVLMMEAHDRLDAAMVYEANCQKLQKGLEFVRVDHPSAKAVQDIAAGRDTRYPRMVDRLIDALRSAASRDRFTSNGFSWVADRTEP